MGTFVDAFFTPVCTPVGLHARGYSNGYSRQLLCSRYVLDLLLMEYGHLLPGHSRGSSRYVLYPLLMEYGHLPHGHFVDPFHASWYSSGYSRQLVFRWIFTPVGNPVGISLITLSLIPS